MSLKLGLMKNYDEIIEKVIGYTLHDYNNLSNIFLFLIFFSP